MKKVSVIVPVYNIQDYVSQCIDSITNQDYKNLEIILVNDGSTDNSLEICEKFAEKDSRIRIINGQNAGLGAARNRGIDCETGEYITFIDGDDFIESNYVSALVDQKEKYNSNIAVTFNKEFFNDTYYVLLDPAPGDKKYDGAYSPGEWLKTFFPTSNSAYNCAWMKLYDRSLFDNIKYPERHMVIEDAFTTWKLILSSHKVSFENVLTYNYRKNRADSITSKGENTSFRYANVKVLEEKISVMSTAGLDSTYMYHYFEQCVNQLYQVALKTNDYDATQAMAFKLQLINKYRNRK